MKPILFNTEMVNAILDGRKTVTRRVVKPKPPEWFIQAQDVSGAWFFNDKLGDNDMMAWWPSYEKGIAPPYRPGDILYVRETFRVDYLSNIPGSGRIHYKADDTYRDFTFAPERYEMMRRAQLKPGWRPNENMPKEAARLFLRVTDVSVEKLQNIDDEGVVAEGMEIGAPFDELWDRTIKPAYRAIYGWEANPWVWVIEFERISKEEVTDGLDTP